MLSVRRALLSASIIPVMLKGSITAFWTISLNYYSHPAIPAGTGTAPTTESANSKQPPATEHSPVPSRQAQPQGGRWRLPFTISFRSALPPYNKL